MYIYEVDVFEIKYIYNDKKKIMYDYIIKVYI